MANAAFDTLAVARRLKDAGFKAEQADAIVDAVDRFNRQVVTIERFDAGIARLDGRIDGLDGRIDGLEGQIDGLKSRTDALMIRIDASRTEFRAGIETLRAELQAGIQAGRADTARFLVIAVGVIIAANALMIAILRYLPAQGAGVGT